MKELPILSQTSTPPYGLFLVLPIVGALISFQGQHLRSAEDTRRLRLHLQLLLFVGDSKLPASVVATRHFLNLLVKSLAVPATELYRHVHLLLVSFRTRYSTLPLSVGHPSGCYHLQDATLRPCPGTFFPFCASCLRRLEPTCSCR